MKRISKIFSLVLLLVISLSVITGCDKKKNEAETKSEKKGAVETISYDGNKLKATFEVSKSANAKISTESDDFRTSREKAIIIADDFKIGIEENDDLSYSNYSGDFDKYKKAHKENTDYKATKLSGLDAFTQYYGSYVRYEAYLKVSDKYILKLNIYSTKDTEEETKKQFDSQVVKDILDSVKVEVK